MLYGARGNSLGFSEAFQEDSQVCQWVSKTEVFGTFAGSQNRYNGTEGASGILGRFRGVSAGF